MADVVLKTGDGLALTVGADGGFALRDVAAKGRFAKVSGGARAEGKTRALLEGADEVRGLRLTARYEVTGAAIRIEGELQDLTGRDRAITVRFGYPLEALGGQWWDHAGGARTIQVAQTYGNFADRGAGATGQASRYPFACVTGGAGAAAIGAPLDQPRLWRFGYDAAARELYAEVDLGLSPETRRFPGRAAFSLVLFSFEAAWGFRAALARYYELFPHYFTKRNTEEGIWMPFTDIATVEGWEDFGFHFKEGDNNVPFDHAHGISSFFYVEPWSNWVKMPPEMPRTAAEAKGLVARRAAEGDGRDRATLASAVATPQGEWLVRIEKEPWCDGAVICLNPNPAAPGPGSQFDALWQRIEQAFARNPGLSGLYHDSFEMYLFPRALNYRREHFAEVSTPLVFDGEGRVCQTVMFDMVDFARAIAERMWARGKMTFANGVPFATPWGAAWLDVMGTEFSHDVAPELANYWRAICYQRPYLLLFNTDYTVLKPAAIERYMQWAAAYGFFPSFFSHNASEDPYWGNPALYHRDRPLFKKYIPVIKRLSAAGWEPVTHAQADREEIHVERFGRPGGPLFFTVFNTSEQTVRTQLNVALPGVAGARLREIFSGAELGEVPAALEVGPREVRVFEAG